MKTYLLEIRTFIEYVYLAYTDKQKHNSYLYYSLSIEKDLFLIGIRYLIGKTRTESVLHREDGPAMEYVNGSKEYYVMGKRHRLDGPAYIIKDFFNNSIKYYVNDVDVTHLVEDLPKEDTPKYLKTLCI